jgi:hypothetical protein
MKLGICVPHYGRPIEVSYIVALDVSFTTFPAMLETINALARDVRPRPAG